MSKTCTSCNMTLDKQFFYKRSARKKAISSECKQCLQQRALDFKRTKKGWMARAFQAMKQRERKRGHCSIDYNLGDFERYISLNKDFDKLYNKWVKSGYKKSLAPSVDRLEDTLGYSIGNIQITSWKDNNKKSHEYNSNGKSVRKYTPVLQYFDGKLVGRFFSIAEAGRKTGIPSKYIQRVVNGDRNKTCGFEWRTDG